MSFEFEDQSLQDKASEEVGKSQKLSKISYTREFLLSLSELEICKDLPRGFDRSILGEFEDTTQQRIPGPGSFPLQGFRRADHSSSPPTRGDTSNYSRGVYGKWGGHSSAQSDKDGDTQSDWDSESGRRYGNATRRSGQSTDHDGLLGSGSFPRPSRYAAGLMASKVRGDDQFHLKKSNEPYHPPRPYKEGNAAPHSRREFSDSLNDETFGSTDLTNEDRAEAERKRRASFELMRKEQQKVLQEKQKLHINKPKDDLFTADSALLEQNAEGRSLEQNKELDGSRTQPLATADSGNSSFPSHTSVPRPLVPPGFASTLLEKSSGPKALSFTHEKEIGHEELGEMILHAKARPVQNGILNRQEERQPIPGMVMSEQKHTEDSIHAVSATKGEKMVNPFSGLDVTQIYGSSSIVKTDDALADSELIQFNTKTLTMNDPVSGSNQDKSTSILEKLFGSSLTVNPSSSLEKTSDSIPAVTRSAKGTHSSKFSHWFLEEEKKSPEDLTSVGPDNFLSLIVGGEKAGVQASIEATQLIPPELGRQSSVLTSRTEYSISSATTGKSDRSYNSNKVEAVPSVLTCEDLEQKILSEYSENSSTLQPGVCEKSASDVETLQSKVCVDSTASLHLLELLQKGANLKDLTPSPSAEIELSDESLHPETRNTVTSIDKSREVDAEPLRNSGKSVTLEALFGTAFMKELQSVEAPVSVHRSVVESKRADYTEHRGLPFHVRDDESRPATVNEIESNQINFENGISASNSEPPTKQVNIENWLGFADPQINIESLQSQKDGRVKHGLHGVVQSQLPEEENLLVGDPLNPSKSRYLPTGNSENGELLSSASFNIAEKLAALNAGYKDERSLRAQGPQLIRGPYDLTESERQYHNLHAKASPPQYHSPQMSHGRPLFSPVDPYSAHLTSQMKIMAPEGIKHDGRTNNQVPVNMIRPPFHQQNTAPSGFDIPVHHQMLQQMQMPVNFPPPNVLHEFPRGGQVLPRRGNQPNAFMQEPNLLQGFPFGQRQPNIGGLGMPLPGAPDFSGGSNHPEALQRLFSMERANPKQMQPFAMNSQGVYSQDLDMSFRQR